MPIPIELHGPASPAPPLTPVPEATGRAPGLAAATEAARAPLPAAETLARCRKLVEPALREAVHGLHRDPGRIASHAFGWCDVNGEPSTGGGGKGVRPALTVLGAEAVGAGADVAVPAAVAIELIHTFSLMHDDIMDGDERRRHRDSAWKAFGTGPAVLAGDALFALAVRVLSGADGARGGPAVHQLSLMLGELVHGQADDVLFETRPWTGRGAVGLAEYRAMAARKTGALLGCATSLGPTLAGAHPRRTNALAEAGRQWGLAFQAADDVLGIWGDPAVTGKSAHSDLRRGKKTLPVLAAIALTPAIGPHLERLLGGEGPQDDDRVRRAADLIDEAGGRAYALRDARTRVAAARDGLRAAPLVAAPVDELIALSEVLVDRRA